MKHYQDTKTGKVYAFEGHINPFKLNNRNLPLKTLTETVKEKPNENYFWYEEDWVYKNELPKDYEEPISDIPCFSPAWVSFLFPVGTIIVDDSVSLDISLNQINSNKYDWKEFSKIILAVPDINDNDLPILITVDGGIMLPNCERYCSQEIAINEMNKIRGALFLGGTLIKQIDINDLEQGKVEKGGGYTFLYKPSFYNRIRLGGTSLSERIVLSHLNRINMKEINDSFDMGRRTLEKIQVEFSFLIKGYFEILFNNSSNGLLNLWIVVEKLIDKIWENQKDTDIRKMLHKIKYNDKTIERRILFLKESDTITEKSFQILHIARDKRNDLIHSAIIPDINDVEKVWIVLFDLVKVAYGIELINLKNKTIIKDNKQREVFNRGYANYKDETVQGNRNFDDWTI